MVRRDALANPWHGVSLGGWLLLEPGPSYPLFERHTNSRNLQDARCEWDLLKILYKSKGKKKAAEVIMNHRETHVTKADFQRIRECGLNAVRLPFGYWLVVEPAEDDIYIGPGIEYIDRAVNWAEECGLQIVLDLHGCPGGESGEAPCGRRQRNADKWHHSQWRMKESLDILEMLASRYKSRTCVTGIAVCNEPSNTVPATRLCRYYQSAVQRIRDAGMPASRVAVVLPVFQRDEDEFIKRWQALTGGRLRNICFDVHCYHCFENEFHGKSMAQQLRAVEGNVQMLRKYPMVVGEWSLALGNATWETCGAISDDVAYTIFGSHQLRTLKEASHGNFFWNWTEANDKEWNFQLAHRHGFFAATPRALPRWDGTGEDPLEEELYPSPQPESRVFFGDLVYIRVFHGMYVDVHGAEVGAQYCDKGTWQELSFWPVASEVLSQATKREVRNGDVVRVRAHNGRFFVVGSDGVVRAERGARDKSAEFTVCIEGATTLRHRGIVFLKSRATSLVLAADEEEEGIYARWNVLGWWQQLAVEKVPEETPGLQTSPRKAALARVLQKEPVEPMVLAVGRQRAASTFPKQIDITVSKELMAAVMAVATPSKARRRVSILADAFLTSPVNTSLSVLMPRNVKRRLASGASSPGCSGPLAADGALKDGSRGDSSLQSSQSSSGNSQGLPPAKMARYS